MSITFKKSILTIVSAIGLASCSTYEILSINSLSDGVGKGYVDGMLHGPDNEEINLIATHGMGWTEEPSNDEFGLAILTGIAEFYDDSSPTISFRELNSQNLGKCSKENGFKIKPNSAVEIPSDVPGNPYELESLACLEKHTYLAPDGRRFNVYRIFWDDLYWDSVSQFNIGYDDKLQDVVYNPDGTINAQMSEDSNLLHRSRISVNGGLKNGVVNWGLGDAALYLGPVGQHIRQGHERAICQSMLNMNGLEISTSDLTPCRRLDDLAKRTELKKVSFFSYSLGSRVLYDVLKPENSEELTTNIRRSFADKEIYMFANQIPLLGIGRAQNTNTTAKADVENPRIIAFSEIDDLLTFELVPYFSRLGASAGITTYRTNYTLYDDGPSYRNVTITCSDGSITSDPSLCQNEENLNVDGDVENIDYDGQTRSISVSNGGKIANAIGFDIIDVRQKFARPIIPFFLNNPQHAHTGHEDYQQTIKIILCGIELESRESVSDNPICTQ